MNYFYYYVFLNNGFLERIIVEDSNSDFITIGDSAAIRDSNY